jgi:uncharacterized protein (DUF934 family)
MPQLINNGKVQQDDWIVVEKDAELNEQQLSGREKLLLPLQIWLAHCDQLASNSNIGLWLDSDEEPLSIGALDPALTVSRCKSISLIAINFPVFSDGRGYSYARQLRDRFGYQGELRAIGDVLQDQLFFYQRCGFNSFSIRQDCNAETALGSLNDFSVVYQATNDNAMPAYRRRT